MFPQTDHGRYPYNSNVLYPPHLIFSQNESQGLWNAMCTAENEQKDMPPSSGESEAGTVTYERKHLSHTDLAQLSKDFDVVIVAAGAGD